MNTHDPMINYESYWIVSKRLITEVGLNAAAFMSALMASCKFLVKRGLMNRDLEFVDVNDFVGKKVNLSTRAAEDALETLRQSKFIMRYMDRESGDFKYRINLATIAHRKYYQDLNTKYLKTDNNKKIIIYNNNSLSPSEKDNRKEDRKKFQKRSITVMKELQHPDIVQRLLDANNDFGLYSTSPDKNPAAYIQSVKALDALLQGKFFRRHDLVPAKYSNRKFTEEEIRLVLSRIAKATRSDYEPKPETLKQRIAKMPMYHLLYNRFARTDMFRSCFLYFFENDAKMLVNRDVELVEDLHPKITIIYRTFYRKQVLGDLNVSIPNVVENAMRQAAAMTVSFYDRNAEKLKNQFFPLSQLAPLVCRALLNSYGGNAVRINANSFVSDYTWNKVVPSYLRDQGIIGEATDD